MILIVMVGFGGGLTWGARITLKWWNNKNRVTNLEGGINHDKTSSSCDRCRSCIHH